MNGVSPESLVKDLTEPTAAEEQIRRTMSEMGERPSELRDIVDKILSTAISRTAQLVRPKLESQTVVEFVRCELAAGATQQTFIFFCVEITRKIIGQKEKIRRVNRYIIENNYQTILVAGAGLSAAVGIPSTDRLGPILVSCRVRDYRRIQDLDQFPQDKQRKILNSTWSRLSRDRKKRMEFQRRFTAVCCNFLSRKPELPVHTLIAECFENNTICEIITTNWDNLIEHAFKSRTNGAMPKISDRRKKKASQHQLWKLHGDVEDKDIPFVLPNVRKATILRPLQRVLKERAQSGVPLILLVVGYSGGESIFGSTQDAILDNTFQTLEGAIRRLQRQFYSYRISLDISDEKVDSEHFLIGTAQWILPQILERSA
jgi:hypothetical protein